MPLRNPDLNKLLQNKDLDALKKLAIPVHRQANHTMSFRSAMMVSAHNLQHLIKIPAVKAECLMLNLEDGVSSEEKPYALVLCALALASNPVCDKKLIVRVNALDEGGDQEIAYLNAFMPDGIRIPKIRSVEDVQRALDLIDEGIEVHLSIETKEAWLNLANLSISPRIKAYYLGILDLYADLKLSQSSFTPTNPIAYYLLSHFLITTRACSVKPVSFVYQDYKNSDTLRQWLELEKSMGLDAKGCIAPVQVDLIHEMFDRNIDEISRANEIITLFEESAAHGITGFVNEKYGFIDEPIYKGALTVVNR